MATDMKKYTILAIAGVFAVLLLNSCRKESALNPESIITMDSGMIIQNDFDRWLDANYVKPYNIQVKYRYEMNESDFSYYTIPPSYDYAVMMAHIVKYLCIDTYDEVAGIGFTRQYFPKMFFYTGEWEYKNNGTYILGTAEGGRKIFLAGLNYLPKVLAGEYQGYSDPAAGLNHFYIKTIHHEFTHIMNQTKDYPEEFKQITPTNYVQGDWSTSDFGTYYRQRGFLSTYSQDSDREDFAEILSLYVTNSAETFEEWLSLAGREVTEEDMDEVNNSHYVEFHHSFPDLTVGGTFPGRELIKAKVDIVRSYMKNNFDIDIDQLRATILRRQEEVMSGQVDLMSLEIR